MSKSSKDLLPVAVDPDEDPRRDSAVIPAVIARPQTSETSKSLVKALVDSTRAISSQSVELEGLRVEQRSGFGAIKEAIERSAIANAARDSDLLRLTQEQHKQTDTKLTSMDSSLLGLLDLAKRRDEREQEDHEMGLKEREADLARKSRVKDARANVSVVLWGSTAKWAAAIGGSSLIAAVLTWLMTR